MLFASKSSVSNQTVLFALLLFSVTVTSCVKNIDATPDNPSSVDGKSLKEISAPANFSWQSSKNITIKVNPMPPTTNRTMALEIRSEDGALLFVQQVTMHQALEQQITVAAGIDKVKMTYGDISKTIDVVNGIVVVDYSLPIPSQYE